ncbi:MAG TPA: trypsin-like peptidase domain-containing protein [Kofleriaceae bacterium]|nr:trypsin-like peptidase domain-containing protein [Kofleriaceae bacterium]
MIRTIQVKHALVASGCAALVATAVGFLAAEAQVPPSTQPPQPPALAASIPGTASISDVAEHVVGSVVNVSSTQQVEDGPAAFDPFFSNPFSPGFGDDGDQRMAQSMGSGVIVSADGRVLTNAHVVHGADAITVTLQDDSEYKAKVLGIDTKADLAVLQLQGKLPPLTPITFADSSKIRLGEVVLAVGDPFGVGKAVTMGIVSATGRNSVGIEAYEDFIQTDAAINPGNSGGALVNMRGELVGINTAILSRSGGYQGIGFAIPSNMAHSIMDMLVKDGRVSRGYLGVGLAPLDTDAAAKLKLAPRSGVLIAKVEPATPAANAGITPGTVITAVDGQAVTEPGKLRNLVAMTGGNHEISLAVIQDGKQRTLKVKLGELPNDDEVVPASAPSLGKRGHGRGMGVPGMGGPGTGGTWHGESVIIHPDGRVERRQLP